MSTGLRFKKILQHHTAKISPSRQRGSIIRSFAKTMGFVYFGHINQHEDDIDTIRGFTTSLTHQDKHYAVGTYKGYNIRIVDRYDAVKNHIKRKPKKLNWLIIEIELETHGIPHIAIVPTGAPSGNYAHLYTVNPNLAPLNSILTSNHSSKYYGHYQILAATTHSRRIDEMLPSPVIVEMGAKLWPHGIEIARHKLTIYITEHRLSKTMLESALSSSLWLAEVIDNSKV